MLENKAPLAIYILIGLFLTIIIFNNISSILNYKKGIERIDTMNTRLDQAQNTNMELKAKIEETQSPEYQQKLAIEELNLVSEDATILVISEENNFINDTQDKTHSPKDGVTIFSKWKSFLNIN